MYDLNELELASVVGGASIWISHSDIENSNIIQVQANTSVSIKNSDIDYSYVGNGNGAYIDIYAKTVSK